MAKGKTIGKRARATTTKTRSGKTIKIKKAIPLARETRKMTTEKTQKGKTIRIQTSKERKAATRPASIKEAQAGVKRATRIKARHIELGMDTKRIDNVIKDWKGLAKKRAETSGR